MKAVWRLIVDAPRSGAENMALDRALLSTREADAAPPTLRLYRWNRPTVTLGRFQDPACLDPDAADRYSVDVVRRATGGRGVLHDDELTYAMVAGIADGIPRGVAASYRMLCAPLAEAYRILGVDAGITARDGAGTSSAACYLHRTRADLSVGARKLSGSAQVWKGATVLQHGSFTRERDVGREAAVFRLDGGESAALVAHCATLSDELAVVPTIESIEVAVVAAFERVLGIRLDRGTFTSRELDLAETLLPLTCVDEPMSVPEPTVDVEGSRSRVAVQSDRGTRRGRTRP